MLPLSRKQRRRRRSTRPRCCRADRPDRRQACGRLARVRAGCSFHAGAGCARAEGARRHAGTAAASPYAHLWSGRVSRSEHLWSSMGWHSCSAVHMTLSLVSMALVCSFWCVCSVRLPPTQGTRILLGVHCLALRGAGRGRAGLRSSCAMWLDQARPWVGEVADSRPGCGGAREICFYRIIITFSASARDPRHATATRPPDRAPAKRHPPDE